MLILYCSSEFRIILLGIATLLTAAAISSSTLPISAIAANYGGFGSSYAEVIDPKTAVLNDETFKSDDVKAGLDGLLNLVKIVGSLKESLVSFINLPIHDMD